MTRDKMSQPLGAWGLWLVACGLVLGACCFFYFLFFLGSVPVDTGLSIDYDLATPVSLFRLHPLLFFLTDPRSYSISRTFHRTRDQAPFMVLTKGA